MRLFQAALDTCLVSPLFCQPLSSRFALHGLRAFDLFFLALTQKRRGRRSSGLASRPQRYWGSQGRPRGTMQYFLYLLSLSTVWSPGCPVVWVSEEMTGKRGEVIHFLLYSVTCSLFGPPTPLAESIFCAFPQGSRALEGVCLGRGCFCFGTCGNYINQERATR